jgi:hypothetical protein
MKLTENSDEIVIRHIPIGKWISSGALIFIFSVFFTWLIYPAIFNQDKFFASGIKDWFEILPILVFAAAGVLIVTFAISVSSLFFAPFITVAINRKTASVDILGWRFYGSETQRFYFYQIRKFKSYKGTANFSSRYLLALVLASGKVMKLRIPVGDDKQNTIKLVKKLNKFVKTKGFH